MRYGWKRKCAVEDPDSEHPEGCFFSYTCAKPLFPAAWTGHQEAAPKSNPGGWGGGKKGRWGGCYCAWGSRKTPPCLCSRGQEADASPGHSTQSSSALRTIRGWVLSNLEAAPRNVSWTRLASCSRKPASDAPPSSKSQGSTTTLAETQFS